MSKVKKVQKIAFKISVLALAVHICGLAYAAEDDELKKKAAVKLPVSAEALPTIEVTAEEATRYEQGKKEQFIQNIVNIYKNKEEVERFKGVNPADLLSGVAGVYSSDARNNGAISPNIRGLQGEGRVPVVVDGTRSEFTVYRGYAGVNNRTYVDPNLISEVKAYKGATELEYGMPQAVGGTVMLNTIDAKDVIPEDKDWGINVKYETNNNSVKPRYPKINYGENFDAKPENFWAYFGDANPQLYIPLNNTGKNKFFDDYAFRVAVAGKNDLTDIMMAYSKREQGNYFSGKKGGEVYKERFTVEDGSDPFFDFAGIVPPGYEVTNTSSNNESILVKNNWYLPNHQTVKLSYRKSDLEYGEIMNSRAGYPAMVKNVFDYGENSTIGTQWTPAKVEQHAGRIDYEFNPDNNKWINLKAGAWLSNTLSENNSSGATIAYSKMDAGSHFFEILNMLGRLGCALDADGNSVYSTDQIVKLNPNCPMTTADLAEARQKYQDYMLQTYGYTVPDVGQYKIVNPALHITRNKRYGFDLANTFEFTPNVKLTVGAEYQKEKLDGSLEMAYSCGGVQGLDANGQCLGLATPIMYSFPPKTGERDQLNTWFNFNWNITPKLTAQFGAKWGRYSIEDLETDEKISNKIYKRKGKIDYVHYTLNRDLTSQDFDEMDRLGFYTDMPEEVWDDGTVFPAYRLYECGQYAESLGYDNGDRWCQKPESNTDIVKIAKQNIHWYADTDGILRKENAPFHSLAENEYLESSGIAYKILTEQEQYTPFGRKKDQAFDPSFSISYQFTPSTRVYARYTQNTRFPSIYENSTGFSDKFRPTTILERNFKPEQARNLEFGIVQDMSEWFPTFTVADLKLNYYHNKVKNVIDRYDGGTFFTQYDSLNSNGLEVQGRFDTGRIFADMSYSYLMKSELCDADASYRLQHSGEHFYRLYYHPRQQGTYQEIQSCFTGGFPDGYLRGAVPPKHSLNINLGIRALQDKIELGTRATYQSMANLKKQKQERVITNFNESLGSYAWKSYWLFDAYVDFKPTSNAKFSLIGTNLGNTYTPDALTRTVIPAPGRTFKLVFDYKF